MESNWGSGESNFSYGGSSSESNYSSESRTSYSSSRSSSSESRQNSSESRGNSYQDWLNTDPWIARGGLSSPSEMHQAYNEWLKEHPGESVASETILSNGEKKQNKYNSLEDIDMLIERLESSMPSNLTSDRANQVLAQRKQKIEELKKLVAAAREAEAEEQAIRQLEQDNAELDNAINSIGKGRLR